MSAFNDNMRWRYATKAFDPSKKLTDAQVHDLLESIQLSASSFGLQPYRIMVVTDPAVRAKVREHAWGQSQITDASHLIAFCALKTIDEKYVDNFVALVAKERGMPVEGLKMYRDMMAGSVKSRTPESMMEWNKCQAYIAVGTLLAAAADAHIDACPMEGFDPTHVDVDLGLLDKNLTTCVLVPIGYRSADDKTAAYKKVRFPKEELFMKL